MKACQLLAFGATDQFKLVDLPRPNISADHVLLEVKASSINQIDIKIRRGLVPEISPTLPAILGADVAGEIIEVGQNVNHLKVGDRVYGMIGGLNGLSGALAQYVSAHHLLLAPIPHKLSYAEAAALPLVGLTAYDALFGNGSQRIGSNTKLLIHGGLGGVGHVALQLVKHTGATIVTTVSDDRDFQLAKQFGATHVVNYKRTTVNEYVNEYTDGQGFDSILDTVGGPNLENSLQAAIIYGNIVTIAARTNLDLTPLHNKGLTLRAVFTLAPLLTKRFQHLQTLLSQFTKMVDQFNIKPLLAEQQFSLDSAAKAHDYLESGKARGKVVISHFDVI